jgi:hypothetical protein
VVRTDRVRNWADEYKYGKGTQSLSQLEKPLEHKGLNCEKFGSPFSPSKKLTVPHVKQKFSHERNEMIADWRKQRPSYPVLRGYCNK